MAKRKNNKSEENRGLPRVSGEVRLKGNCIKVNNLPYNKFLETVELMMCKTR